MSEFLLPYGRDFLKLSLPSGNFLAEINPVSFIPEIPTELLVSNAIENAFKHKKDILQRAKTLIILPDKTRNAGCKLFLPVLLERLHALNIKTSEIRFLLANGSHNANNKDELITIVGEEIYQKYNILQHNCHAKDDLAFLGATKFGTPVLINKHISQAEQVLIAGTAVHHYFAGFGGGPKMIMPGCAGYETIRKNHALTISRENNGIHPGCKSGVLDKNPIQEDIKDAIKSLHVDLLLETVLNDQGQIAKVFAGELFETHRSACQFVDELYKVPIQEKADLVVVSCGGFPKDINLIQAHKSMHNAFQAVKNGGVILVLAECSQGIGSETFMDWFNIPDYDSLVEALATNYTLNGTTALAFRLKSKIAKIVLVSALKDETAKKMGLLSAKNLAEGIKIALKYLPSKYTWYVIKNGSLTLPVSNDN